MSTHNIGFYDSNEHQNIGFYEDLTKIIFQLSSNMYHISSSKPEDQWSCKRSSDIFA